MVIALKGWHLKGSEDEKCQLLWLSQTELKTDTMIKGKDGHSLQRAVSFHCLTATAQLQHTASPRAVIIFSAVITGKYFSTLVSTQVEMADSLLHPLKVGCGTGQACGTKMILEARSLPTQTIPWSSISNWLKAQNPALVCTPWIALLVLTLMLGLDPVAITLQIRALRSPRYKIILDINRLIRCGMTGLELPSALP